MTTRVLSERAQAIREAACLAGDDGLATIVHTHVAMYEASSLESFKEELWELALAGELQLASHDLLTRHTEAERRVILRGEIVKGESRFHLIRC